jgi:RNA polymerase sigma-70 factor (ECF subfamily)
MERIIKLYESYKESIFGYFLRMTGNWEEAADLTQETFYQACLSLFRFRGDASLKTWLFSIARNVYLKSVRDKGKRRAVIREGPLPENQPAPGLPDPSAEALLLKEERERIRKFEGLSYEEIAAVFGQTANWARVSFFRAKKRLREICREQEDDGI